MMTDIPRSHPCQNWTISHHFPHLQTLFGLHLRPSWDKNEGQIQLDNMHEHGKLLRSLAVPMAEDTSRKVQQLITVLHNEHHINEMTEKWLCQTPNPPRILVFYTLTKIHKPTWEALGVSGLTEKLSAFVAILLQPLAQQQKSYLKD